MNTVYMVYIIDEDYQDLLMKAFSTREKAEVYIKDELEFDPDKPWKYEIREWKVE